MSDNYAKIVRGYLERLNMDEPKELAENLLGERRDGAVVFHAFGGVCRITPDGITLDGEEQTGVIGILLSLCALHAGPHAPVLLPFRAFREFPDAMPYVGAFATHTEQILVPHVDGIEQAAGEIRKALGGEDAPADVGGDFSFVLRPLPKIALCYIFYKADDEFPASATCLFSNNAPTFLPMDGLADTGEYTSRKILEIAGTA